MGSNPGRVRPNTWKLVLVAILLRTQQLRLECGNWRNPEKGEIRFIEVGVLCNKGLCTLYLFDGLYFSRLSFLGEFARVPMSDHLFLVTLTFCVFRCHVYERKERHNGWKERRP